MISFNNLFVTLKGNYLWEKKELIESVNKWLMRFLFNKNIQSIIDTSDRKVCSIYECQETNIEKMWGCLSVGVSIKEKESPPGDRLLYFCIRCREKYFIDNKPTS